VAKSRGGSRWRQSIAKGNEQSRALPPLLLRCGGGEAGGAARILIRGHHRSRPLSVRCAPASGGGLFEAERPPRPRRAAGRGALRRSEQRLQFRLQRFEELNRECARELVAVCRGRRHISRHRSKKAVAEEEDKGRRSVERARFDHPASGGEATAAIVTRTG